MGVKKLVAIENELEHSLVMDARKPASAASIMDSMVATEAELRSLWADMDRNADIGVRDVDTRNGVS